MSKSLLQTEKECYITHYTQGLHKHHIFGGALRDLSEEYGLWVWLREDYHLQDSEYPTPHNDEATSIRLKQEAQEAFEKKYGHEKFMQLFGRNYIGR